MTTKGVIWVSTVLYVLIGLAIVGGLLAIVKPKIAETSDRLIIDQTKESINVFDDLVIRTREAVGTRLSYKIKIDKGSFVIDCANEKLYWYSTSSYKPGEENVTISEGDLKLYTTREGGVWNVTLTRDFSRDAINFSLGGDSSKVKVLTKATTPYRIWISNNGTFNNAQQIDLEIE